MPQSLDIWSIIIIVSIAHSVFAINLLGFKKEFQHKAGFWLLMFLLSLLWLQVEFLAIRWPFNVGLDVFYGTRHGSWLLVGPLYYFYIKSITREETQKLDYLFLLPFIVFTVVLPLLVNDFLSFRQVHYGMLTPFDGRPDELSVLQYFYSFLFIFQFFYLAYFLFLTRKEINNYVKRLRDSLSSINREMIYWLKTTWISVVLILIICTSFLVLLFFFTEYYRRHFDYLYVLPMSFLVYAISYKLAGVRWQMAEPTMEESIKYQKSGLTTKDAKRYEKKLEQLLREEKLYLNQGLRLKDLSEHLKVPSHTISQVLNQQMNTTLYDWVNQFRVIEAKRLIQLKPEQTLLHIAFEAGFNNKTSFVNAFKKFAGETPSSFMRKSTP
ncbi:MAG: helix-turn-helix domain-containing protein [Bacteroidota bacterium]